MDQSIITKPTRSELLFWSEIMADHAWFLKDSLLPGHPDLLIVAEDFCGMYERIRQKLKEEKVADELFKEILGLNISFREFKREMLGLVLEKPAVSALPPTIFNLMLNEVEEFIHYLSRMEQGEKGERPLLGQHLLWLRDSAGHAAALLNGMDKVEARYREEGAAFLNTFDKMYLHAVELAGYCRSDPKLVQAFLQAFGRQSASLIREFQELLKEIESGLIQREISSGLHPLFLNHMGREAGYYLKKMCAVDAKPPEVSGGF